MNPFADIGKTLTERPGHAYTESLKYKGGRVATDNPWGLTACEEKALMAIVEGGTSKGAAEILGLSHKTVENHSARAREKMGVNTTIHAILVWDRQFRATP